MDFSDFFTDLGLKAPDKCFEDTFASALEEYKNDGVFFLNNEYIDHINSFECCISNCIGDAKRAANKILERKHLAVYALFLYRAMQQRQSFMMHLREFEFPKDGDAECDMLPFLVIITAIPKLHECLKKRGVPSDIIAKTLRQFEDCVYLTEERTGRPGYLKRYFDHMQGYIDEKILNVGRLRFEMIPKLYGNIWVLENRKGELAILFDGVKINSAGMLFGTPPACDNQSSTPATVVETQDSFIGRCADSTGKCVDEPSEYPKSEWHLRLKKGDPVLGVHIPSKGALTKEACEESYARACEVFKNCYPEFAFKAFHCRSWMLDPTLRECLPESSNILAFQKKYTLYAGKTDGKAVFNFVFKMQPVDYNDLPEDTTLQRALKKLYLDGKYIYELSGIIVC